MSTVIKPLKPIKFSKAVLFVGLPGIGLVGKITVDYLLKQFRPERVAEVFSDSFPPSVRTRASIVELIKDEIFHLKLDGRDFLFLAGPVQPALDIRVASAQEHYDFAREIVKACKELGVSEVYTLAGINIGERRMSREPEIVFASTSKKLIEELKALGLKPSRDEGLISGAAGMILGFAKEEGINGACLMGETNARLIYGDHGAAKKLVEFLVKRYGFKVDMGQIEKEAREIEKAFNQLSKSLGEQDEIDDSGPSYIR